MAMVALNPGVEDDVTERAVRRFFECLARGDTKTARRLTAAGFCWFGQAMNPERWASERFAKFLSTPMRVVKTQRLSIASIRTMPKKDQFTCFGGVGEGNHVVFIDVQRGGRVVTVIVVTCLEGKDEKIQRLLDPMAFSEFLRFERLLRDSREIDILETLDTLN